jgi:hypothetical protein
MRWVGGACCVAALVAGSAVHVATPRAIIGARFDDRYVDLGTIHHTCLVSE